MAADKSYKKRLLALVEQVSELETLKATSQKTLLQSALDSLKVTYAPHYSNPVCERRLLAGLDAAQRGSEILDANWPVDPRRLKSAYGACLRSIIFRRDGRRSCRAISLCQPLLGTQTIPRSFRQCSRPEEPCSNACAHARQGITSFCYTA